MRFYLVSVVSRIYTPQFHPRRKLQGPIASGFIDHNIKLDHAGDVEVDGGVEHGGRTKRNIASGAKAAQPTNMAIVFMPKVSTISWFCYSVIDDCHVVSEVRLHTEAVANRLMPVPTLPMPISPNHQVSKVGISFPPIFCTHIIPWSALKCVDRANTTRPTTMGVQHPTTSTEELPPKL
jgi:hypothetical protein